MRLKFRYLLMGVLVGAILICPAMAASPFPDVDENADYAKAVDYLNSVGIMQGDDKGNFNPNKTVTRAEMAAIICRLLGESENLSTSNAFSDVPVDHWANRYVTKAAELGIVGGYGNGKFGPSDTVTYEQAIAMVVRSMGLEEIALEAGGYPQGYIFVADNYGYSSNISASKGDLLKRQQVAVIFYNTIA